jgi:flavin reductase (DIM6/NTAB) family NADH-FMN oxidoreductase RutF
MTHIIDPTDFRTVLGHFCSGITIISAMCDGVPVGFTCQSFFSLSLDPPLIAFSPATSSKTYPDIRKAGHFCVNVLADDQSDVCMNFARSNTDKWKDVTWEAGTTGSPIIENVLAWIDCRIEAEHEAGDHFITVGRVLKLGAREGSPLLYFKAAFGHFKATA